MKQVAFIALFLCLAAGQIVAQPTGSGYLTIEGMNIWVRSEPSTGKVVMKLNNGDRCKVLKKGDYQEIRDMKDYWYQIEFQGKTGWVYGAQTSLKMAMNFEVFTRFFGNKQPLPAAFVQQYIKKDYSEANNKIFPLAIKEFGDTHVALFLVETITSGSSWSHIEAAKYKDGKIEQIYPVKSENVSLATLQIDIPRNDLVILRNTPGTSGKSQSYTEEDFHYRDMPAINAWYLDERSHWAGYRILGSSPEAILNELKESAKWLKNGDECGCMSWKIEYRKVSDNLALFSIARSDAMTHYKYTLQLIAFKDGDQWDLNPETGVIQGGYDKVLDSPQPNKIIVQTIQERGINGPWDIQKKEHIYLLDKTTFQPMDTGIESVSCSTNNGDCNCEEDHTRTETLRLVGSPVNQIVKTSQFIFYDPNHFNEGDDHCVKLKSTNDEVTYKWDAQNAGFKAQR